MNLIEFLDSIDVPAYIVDRRRIILFWNKSAEKLVGYSKEEVVGSSCADNVLKHIDRNGIVVCYTDLCPLIRSIKSGRYFRVPFAVYSLKKSGERLPVSVYAFPIKDENGKVVGAIEMFEDASESDRELSKAFEIQQSLLPKEDERVDYVYYPSNVLGGDLIYYNFPWVALVDISDHGLAAALLSTSIKLMFDSILSEDLKVEDVSILLEREFSKIETQNYFTAVLGRFVDGGIEIVSFGHPDPIVFDGEKAEILEVPRTFPVGLGFIDSKVEPTFVELDRKKILFYSDGVTEVKKKDGEMIGSEGLAEIFSKFQDLKKIYEIVMDMSVEPFQSDDMSMILVS